MSDKPKCAWCKIDTKKQLHVKPDELPEDTSRKYPYRVSKCPTCGGLRDPGQMDISINSMRQIYDGCVSLINELVGYFDEAMSYAKVSGDDLADFLGCDHQDNGGVTINISVYDIARELFLSHTENSGGTSTGILLRKLGIDKDYEEFTFGENEDD